MTDAATGQGSRRAGCRRGLRGPAGRWGCLLALCACAAAAAGADDDAMRGHYRQRAAEIHRHTMALEAAWCRLLQREHPQRGCVLFTLTLRQAVVRRDVVVEAVHSPVIGWWARAWAPGLNRAVHEVDVTGPAGRTAHGPGPIALTMDLRLCMKEDRLGRQMMNGLAEVPATVRVKAVVDGATVTGTYALAPTPLPPRNEKEAERPSPLAAAEGAVTGTRATLSRALEPKPQHWALRKQEGLDDLYALAVALESVADRWYQRIRALEIVRRHRLGYAEALSEALLPGTRRPALKLGWDLGDDPGLEDIGLGGPAAPTRRKAHPDQAAEAAAKAEPLRGRKVLDGIAERVARMVEMVRQYEQAEADPPFIADTLATGDPEFGPWYGEESLARTADGVNALPAGAGADGPPDWRSVIGWEALGPFPLTRAELLTPWLPDMVWVGGEACLAARERLGRRYTGPDVMEWEPCPASRGFGYVAPPRWFSFNPYSGGLPPALGYREYQNKGHFGLPNSTAYLRCTVASGADVELWAGLGLNQRGRLWLNDRLVWCGPGRVDAIRHEFVALIRIPFRKGLNHLVLRVDTDYSSAFAWLRLCVRGRPWPAAKVKAKAAAVAAKRALLPPDPAVGWRGDGAGVYPGSRPPVAWNRKQKQNVLWQTPLPYWGNATAVPAPGTDRLFVTMEPHWLICLSKKDGAILWKRACTLLDLLPQEQRKKGWALYEAWWTARRQRDAVPASRMREPKWLRYEWYWAEGTGLWAAGKDLDEREGASPELLALLDKRGELEKSPDPQAVQAELTRVAERIEKLKAKAGADDADSPQAKAARVRQAEQEFRSHLQQFCHLGAIGGYWYDYTGYAFATPVTDGKHVWVKNGMDVAACYDMDGNEQWKVQVWGTGEAARTIPSPRLVDGKLILQLSDNPPDPRQRARRGTKLLALSAETGEKVWETAGLPVCAWNAPTPAVVTLTDGRDVMKVLVTAVGTVVRADDGKVLVRDPGVQCGFESPLVCGDVVVFGHAALAAVQYVMMSRDQVGFRRLWAVRGGAHGAVDCGGELVVDGRIYFTAGIRSDGRRGPGQGHSAPGLRAESGAFERWKAMEVYDLQAGSYAAVLPILRKGGHQYSLACASGAHVYQIIGDHIFAHLHPKAPMDMVVLTRGPEPLRLANNAIDRCYGAGAIEGDRIYIRGYSGVTCIGYTGADGRRYEARIVARNLLDELYPGRPQDGPVTDVPMAAESVIKHYPYGHKRHIYKAPGNCLVLSGQGPHRWWILGPLPLPLADRAMEAFGGPSRPLRADEVVQVGGAAYPWGPLTQDFRQVADFKPWQLEPKNFTDIHRLRRVVDLGKAIGGQQPGVTFLMTELRSTGPQTMRFEQTLPGVRAWLGGAAVRHGDRVRFGAGLCQLLLEVKVESIPPAGLHLSPRFWLSEDVQQEAAAWDAAATRRRPHLQRAIELAPDSPEAARARAVLGALSP